jgi:ribose transport system substrate-binding protein
LSWHRVKDSSKVIDYRKESNETKFKAIKAGLAVASSIALVMGVAAVAAPAQAAGTYKIGVSNWAGNSWRETMVCAIKAQATLSGKVASVTVLSRNTDAAGQLLQISAH